MSQLKKGALLSYFTILITNIVGLFLTPYIILKLGNSEYGLYTLIGAFIGYISIFDLGLNNTIIRFVTKYKTENNEVGEQNFLAISLIIYFFISLLIITIGGYVYFDFDSLFSTSLSNVELIKGKLLFLILIGNIAIAIPGGAFTAICYGYEDFVFPKILNIFRYILRSILVISLLYFGGDSIGIVVVDTIMNIIVILITAFYVLKHKGIYIKLHKFELLLIIRIFKYSIWIFLLAVIGQLFWSSGQIILGLKTNTEIIAIYGVGITLGSYYGAFAGAINTVLLPLATKMNIQNNSNEILEKMIKISRILIYILFFILIAFVVFGKEFIYLWVGNQFNGSWQIAIILMIVYTIPLIQNFAHSLLEAKGLTHIKVIIYFSFIGLGLIIGNFLIDQYEGFGVALGISLGWLVSQVALNIYFYYYLNINIKFFLIQVLRLRTVFSYILLIGLTFFIDSIFDTICWKYFLSKVLIYTIIYIFIIYKLVLNDEEKVIFSNIIKK